MAKLNNHDFYETVADAVEFLSNVSDNGNFKSSPSIDRGNSAAHAIGLGQMNLHGHLIEQGIDYDSEEAVQLWREYMRKVTYAAISASTELAEERGTFEGFAESEWRLGGVIAELIDAINEHNTFGSQDELDM